jgi:hypothetical protein
VVLQTAPTAAAAVVRLAIQRTVKPEMRRLAAVMAVVRAMTARAGLVVRHLQRAALALSTQALLTMDLAAAVVARAAAAMVPQAAHTVQAVAAVAVMETRVVQAQTASFAFNIYRCQR